MNITLIAFQDEKTDRDGEHINWASVRILHPTDTEEAAILYQELLLEAENERQEEWEITVLLNGREADTDEELDFVKLIENPGQSAVHEARARLREKQKKEEIARKERERIADEQARARREQAERETYLKLKAKYESGTRA